MNPELIAEEVWTSEDDYVFCCPHCGYLFREPMEYNKRLYCPHCGKKVLIEDWEFDYG